VSAGAASDIQKGVAGKDPEAIEVDGQHEATGE
jgi:hypothetical protein